MLQNVIYARTGSMSCACFNLNVKIPEEDSFVLFAQSEDKEMTHPSLFPLYSLKAERRTMVLQMTIETLMNMQNTLVECCFVRDTDDTSLRSISAIISQEPAAGVLTDCSQMDELDVSVRKSFLRSKLAQQCLYRRILKCSG